MINYSDLKFKKNRLYHGELDTGISYHSCAGLEKPNHIYQIRYEDGEWSDKFNLSRVRDNAKKYYLSILNRSTEKATEKATGASKQ